MSRVSRVAVQAEVKPYAAGPVVSSGETAPRDVALAGIIDSVACELSDLGGMTDQLQATLGLLMVQPATGGLREVEGLQALDLISQRLAGLASFLAALAPSLPPAWSADATKAAGQVKLADLARRLSHPTQPCIQTDADGLDLF